MNRTIAIGRASLQTVKILDDAALRVRDEAGGHVSRVEQIEELVRSGNVLEITRAIAKRKNGRKK